ncbi:MAG: glycosyltransferase [Bryobacteraceae bacterium]|nr:glycosyltransferase [Bryobacteraceae bacterium]
MAQYVEQTIQSVLRQDYPRIEYIVVDGGSTDGTLEILQRYEDRLRLVSGRDSGAADAVNKGFRLSRGEIFAYLNADDYYLPGAVSCAVDALSAHPDVAVAYGDAEWVDDLGQTLGAYPTQAFDASELARHCFISQPAAFLRRWAFERAGMMDVRLHYTYDYDLWIRIARRHALRKLDAKLAASRMHRRGKSLGARRAVFEETLRLLRHHYQYAPFGWVHSYCAYRLDGRDQFFEPLRPSFFKYAVSLPAGLCLNPDHPFRYAREWSAAMSLAGLRRRLAALFRPKRPQLERPWATPSAAVRQPVS